MEYTEEMSAEFQERAKLFSEEYKAMYDELSQKHLIEILHDPSFVPSPSGIFGVAIMEKLGDLKYKPIAAPVGEVIKA